MFVGSDCDRRSRDFSKYYRSVAEANGCHFMDAAEYASVSDKDFLPMDDKSHEAFANAIYQRLQVILNK